MIWQSGRKHIFYLQYLDCIQNDTDIHLESVSNTSNKKYLKTNTNIDEYVLGICLNGASQ